MQWVDGLGEDDPKNDAVVARVEQIANELARLKQDDGGAWLAEINQRVEGVKPDQR